MLYNVDLTTGRANKIGDMPSETQILALTIPISTASAEAPARVENLKFVFERVIPQDAFSSLLQAKR